MKRAFSIQTLALRSLWFYRRTNASVLLGVVLSGAVLTGALLVGDSVRYSLKRFALLRLGRTELAMQTQRRFFGTALAEKLRDELPDAELCAALQLRGIAIGQGGSDAERRQVNRVQVLGVLPEFWRLAPHETNLGPLGSDGIALSRKLAAALAARVGDEVSLRVEKPALLPRDAPLSSRKEGLSSRRAFTVKRIVGNEEFGRFSLAANQIAPHNAFVERAILQEMVGLEARANLLLFGQRNGSPITVATGKRALHAAWQLAHAGLRLRDLPEYGIRQLESDRIFLDPSAAKAALSVPMPEPAERQPAGVLVYLVNEIAKKGNNHARHTPYSFVTAVSPAGAPLSVVPADMPDDGIVINRWLAEQLDAGPEDVLRIEYLQLSTANEFVTRAREFTVHRIVEMDALRAERALLPEFPGLTDVDTCRNWDIGMPMDEERLKDEANEAYWKQYRGTPKAFVTLRAGQEMWANRFGSLTAVRYPLQTGAGKTLAAAIRDRIDPGQLGFFLLPAREQATHAVSQSMDFGELFLSMSFFLIVAALMLTGLLFVFGVQQRAEEMGTLLANGYRRRDVRRLLLLEGALLAATGSICGALCGIGYTRVLVWGLANYWQGAVAGAAIRYHAEPGTVLVGVVTGFVCATGAMLAAMWRQSRLPARELLQSDLTTARGSAPAGGKPGFPLGLVLSVAGIACALATVLWAVLCDADNPVMPFFAAGALLLVSGIGCMAHGLRRRAAADAAGDAAGRLTIDGLGMRNAARRRGRSLTVAGLLACGCFMLFAVLAMKEDPGAHAAERWSGTGGFALFGESTIAAPADLSEPAMQRRFGLDRAEELRGVEVVSIKVHDGDDASCFNLNRAQAPRLLGVAPAPFAARHAFVPENDDGRLWELLEAPLPNGLVPGLVGDSDTAMWGLQKKTDPTHGDVLYYKDERGERFGVKLVGTLPMRLSILQGTVLISESDFNKRYPSEDGYRMFLFDVPVGKTESVRSVLGRRLERIGLDVSTTAQRLAEFYSVVATYLAMFLVLGGLGLLLGSIGIGIIVLRNVLERRSELALLKCVGFSHRQVARVVAAEHWLLLVLGLALGVVSAGVAIWPNLRTPGVQIPYGTIVALLVGILALGLGWTATAARIALRRPLVPALRDE